MAKRKADCSELQQTISDIALALGMKPNMNVDKITAEMKQKLPWIDRDMVTESIVAANRTVHEEQTEIAKRLSDIKREARTSEALKKAIDKYQKHVDAGTLPDKREVVEPTSAVAALREVRYQLEKELRNSTPAKAQRLQESIEYLRQKDEQLRNGLYVESVKKSEIESYPELSKLIIERDKLKRDVDARIRAKKPLTWGQMLMEPTNFSRAVIASADNSAVGRQGGVPLFMRPGIALNRLSASFKALRFWGPKGDRNRDLGGEFVYEAMEDIESRANRHLYHAGGLEITELDNAKGLGKREEEQVSRFMDWLKYSTSGVVRAAQKPIDASQRAYVTYMNLIRADLFDFFSETLNARGGPLSIQESKDLSYFINVITGRGDLGKGVLKASAEGLNSTFFAPRFLVSRFQFLAGIPYFKAKDRRVKNLIAKEYARYVAGLTVFYSVVGVLVGEALEELLGEDEDWFDITFDPRSSDVGKIRFGNFRMDPLSGLSQVIKFVGQQATGQQKSTKTGEVTALRDSGIFVPFFSGNLRDVERMFGSTKPAMNVGFGGRNQLEAIGHFARTKANPGVGAALNWWNNQKNVVGQDVTILTTVGDLTIPLTPKEMIQTMTDEGIPKGVANGMLNFMGFSAQVYGDTPGTSKGLKPLRPLTSAN